MCKAMSHIKLPAGWAPRIGEPTLRVRPEQARKGLATQILTVVQLMDNYYWGLSDVANNRVYYDYRRDF